MRPPLPTALLRALPALLLLALALLAPATAQADYEALLKDACRDEKVDGTYSQKDYREALANIPADTDQYTNCRSVLRSAQLAAARAQGGGAAAPPPSADPVSALLATGDPLAAATPQEKTAVQQATEQGSAPVEVAGEVVDPSTLGAGRAVAASISDLPAPLLVALAITALGALAALAAVLVPRVRERRRD
ncbi:MAG: hypothetical protein MUC84_03175 [Solirubrobacteraceae bacterium]|nr:hypothetical protein [Solirubrobacteraceae bacterium]